MIDDIINILIFIFKASSIFISTSANYYRACSIPEMSWFALGGGPPSPELCRFMFTKHIYSGHGLST